VGRRGARSFLGGSEKEKIRGSPTPTSPLNQLPSLVRSRPEVSEAFGRGRTNRQGAKSARLRASDDTLDATLNYVDTEVDEEAQTTTRLSFTRRSSRVSPTRSPSADRCSAFGSSTSIAAPMTRCASSSSSALGSNTPPFVATLASWRFKLPGRPLTPQLGCGDCDSQTPGDSSAGDPRKWSRV
jgi:hypothetical protein